MLQIQNLHKSYGEYQALKGLDLSIGKGEIFCLLGQNGAGKTTTINLILGFLKPDEGTITIAGKEVRPGTTDTNIAYIPEIVMLYGYLSALENIDFFSRLAGKKYSREALSAYLVHVGLPSEVHTRRVQKFSKGMRQKVGIAIAIAKGANVILMDEPTSGLDPKAADEFSAIVRQLGAEGKTVLMATHDIFNAVNLATDIGIMKAGKLVQKVSARQTNPDELLKLYLQTI